MANFPQDTINFMKNTLRTQLFSQMYSLDTIERVDVDPQDLIVSYSPLKTCLLYTSPSPRDATLSRMPSSA